MMPKTELAAPAIPKSERGALRAIAAFEAIKGLAALASAVGLLSLLHHDLHHLALALIGHFDLDPSQHFPSLLLQYVDQVNSTPVSSFVMLATGYVALRWVEAYGLWFDRSWGEWVAALSGALYVPFEVRHVMHRATWVNVLVLLLNLVVVGYMIFRLRQRSMAKELASTQ